MAKRDVPGAAAAKDFPRDLVSSLAKRGVRIVGSTWLPGPGGDFTQGERGYLLDDNGTGRVRTYSEVKKLAAEAFESIVSEGRHRRELQDLRKARRGAHATRAEDESVGYEVSRTALGKVRSAVFTSRAAAEKFQAANDGSVLRPVTLDREGRIVRQGR